MYLCNEGTKSVIFVLAFNLVWLYTYIVGVDRTENFNNKALKRNEKLLTETKSFPADATGRYLKRTVDIKEIATEIRVQNRVQWVRNIDKFGPINENTHVLVIQVHSRLEYLRLLIKSLYNVQNIENSLLIFSHDLYLPRINEVICQIRFARVLQIFFPHSIQLHPTHFPGPSVHDCPRDFPLHIARTMRCRNADHPDIYGHYREASFTQTKHHWWWKANFVFDRLTALTNNTGVIAFLEEDHYVAPDLLWVLNLLENSMTRNECHGCNLLAPGTYLKTWTNESASSRAGVTNWRTTHNMGMAFNRSMWNKFKRCAPAFCEYDDYNWDHSLLYVSQTCLQKPLTVLHAEGIRVFHIGDCGTHHKQNTCDPKAAAYEIDARIQSLRPSLFPHNLTIDVVSETNLQLKKGYGGWGDVRDKQLCLSFLKERQGQRNV